MEVIQVSSLKDEKKFHSFASKTSLMSSYVIFDVVGLSRFPNAIDLMILSIWLLICIKCFKCLFVKVSRKQGCLLTYKRGVGGQAIVEIP